MFSASFFRSLPPVTKNLLIINVIVWAFLNITPGKTTLEVLELGGLHYVTSPEFGIWQLFTYMFIHESFMHLFFNMWALLMFGFLIERALGSKRFLFYYLSCGIGAAIVQLIVFAISINSLASHISPVDYNQVCGQLNQLINGTTIGASGAVFGILLAVAMLFPNIPMSIMFIPYPVKAKWMVLGYGILELSLGIAGPSDGIAHFAHLGGMLFGFVMLWYWKHQYRKNGRY